MSTDPHDAPKSDDIDPTELQHALGRTGRMLKTAGLPFEMDEFEESELDAPKDPAPEQDGTSADGGGASDPSSADSGS